MTSEAFPAFKTFKQDNYKLNPIPKLVKLLGFKPIFSKWE